MAWYDPRTWDIPDVAYRIFDPAGLIYDPTEEAARSNISRLQGQAPDAINYSESLRGMANEMGAMRWDPMAYKQSPYYQSLMADVTQQMEDRGRAVGAQHAQRGVAGPGAYGPGRQAQTERDVQTARLSMHAAAQAQMQQAQEFQMRLDSLLKQIGISKGLQDAEWQSKFDVWATKMGVSREQLNAILDKQQQNANTMGMVGGVLAKVFGA